MISSRMQKRLVKMAEQLMVKKAAAYDSCGVCCRWLKMTESWGIKFTNRGYNYLRPVFQNQRRGWRLGLGPFCFGFFKVKIKGFDYYGYITQIALLASNYLRSKFGDNWWKDRYVNKYKPTINKLKKCISNKLNVIANDLHEDNWGFLNGKIVITDWGFV